MSQFQTHKKDITRTRLVAADADEAALGDGEVLLEVERFAFTANNVTYGAVGHQIGYWQFFVPQLGEGDDPDWGLVPVWGFARVLASRNAEVAEGERLYGYLPIAHHLQISPTKVSPQRLVDGAAHRAELPPVYNNYDRLGSASADGQAENLRALLQPLYVTSFCLCDALAEVDYHGAEQVVIVSASSKTALGLAWGLAQIAGDRPRTVGLTSDANAAFVRSTGLYDQVIGYGELASLDNRPSVLVDMSGNRVVLGQVHGALGENMRHCHNVGLTHWDDRETRNDPAAAQIIRERSAIFFAPGHIQRRHGDWGQDEFARKTAEFLKGATDQARQWLKVRQIDGLAAFAPVYDAVVAGDMDPSEGLIVKP